MRSRLTRSFLAVSVLLVAGSCAAPGETALPHLSDRLAWGDHRFLETLEISEATVDRARGEEASLPYKLARALEARGLWSSARRVLVAETRDGEPLWAGLSAARLALGSQARGDFPEAIAAGARAAELAPQNRDGWWAWGEGLYRAERYEELVTWLGELPPSAELVSGEVIDPAEFAAERALWSAVAAWELDRDALDTFREAFLVVPADVVHSRLYLYLFYRDGALERFEPTDRSLLEIVYRAAVGEYSEARRLLEPLGDTTILDALAYRGFQATLAGIAAGGDARFRRRLDGLADAAASDPALDPAAVGALNLAIASAAEAAGETEGAAVRYADLIGDRSTLPSARELALDRWVSIAIDSGAAPGETLEQLARWQADDRYAARALDRLAPAVVRTEGVGGLDIAASALPESWQETRAHLAVLRALEQGGTSIPVDDAGLAAALALPATDYFGLLARGLAGVSAQPIPGGDAGGDAGAEAAADAARDALMHAIALTEAGSIAAARSLALTTALEAGVAEAVFEVARRMSELGHVSAALDVGRRAASRGNLPVTAERAEVLFPLAYAGEIAAAAAAWEVAPAVVAGLVREESHFNPRAVSVVGATGLAQLMPETAVEVARRLRLDDPDLTDPGANLQLGVSYMAWTRERLPDHPILALAAYNAGLGRGRRWRGEFGDRPGAVQIEALPFIETRWYVRRIAVSSSWYRFRLEGADPAEAIMQFVAQEAW